MNGYKNNLALATLGPIELPESLDLATSTARHGLLDALCFWPAGISLLLILVLATPGHGESPPVEEHGRVEAAWQVRELFFAEDAPHLGGSELQQRVEWLFQAAAEGLLTRTGKEIIWTREMIDRLQERAESPDLSDELAALRTIEQDASATDSTRTAAETRTLYFEIRALKRKVMFKSPEIDFSKIICVDAPYTHRSRDTHGTFHQEEWVHESRFRSEMCASHGAQLVILEHFVEAPTPRELAPADRFGQPVAMLSFDVCFEGDRVLFCAKPEDERAYHLYEIGIDGNNFRQMTFGGYSDIDPIYLPGDRTLFLSTRAEVYAQCGMWARSYILTRCDSGGTNITILSAGTEPEFSPSLLDDGRILFTRWEYVDKFANRIQSLWTMRPDGTAAAAYWGNQSVYPDHLGEARQIPGTSKVMFSGFGHHDVWSGCIGIVDPREGLNFPAGIWKVTQEMPWPEVGNGPLPTPGLTERYHTSGKYAAYKTPYPLSDDLFLVSARTGGMWVGPMRSARDPTIGHFKLYLADVYGNRELIYAGGNNVLYAQPVRPRRSPPRLPDVADVPRSEQEDPVIRPGLFFSNNIFDRAPPEVRAHGKYLRVVESMPKNYSVGIVHSGGKPFGSEGPNTAWGAWSEKFLQGKTPSPTTDISWGDRSVFCGPATALTGPLGVKQVHGTVPIRDDGSVCFEVKPCRMLYFQVLDEHYRTVHTMRSWVSARPGETHGTNGYVAVPNTIVTRYDTLPPLTYLSPKSKLIAQAMDRDRCGEKLSPEDLRLLIAWVDLWAMYRSDKECREIEDAPSEWFPLWAYPPKTKTAPRVRTEYSQDEYTRSEDRLPRDER